jgi:hypothetical protein
MGLNDMEKLHINAPDLKQFKINYLHMVAGEIIDYNNIIPASNMDVLKICFDNEEAPESSYINGVTR